MNMLEELAVKKALRRLVPLVVICYFVACLDRVNVGFAALEMNKDLGLTAAAFGFANSTRRPYRPKWVDGENPAEDPERHAVDGELMDPALRRGRPNGRG